MNHISVSPLEKATFRIDFPGAGLCPEPPFRLYFFASDFRQERHLTVSDNMAADLELNNAVLIVFFL